MRTAILTLFLSIAAFPRTASAQQQPACSAGAHPGTGNGVDSKTGAPFLATVKETFEQKLHDGNTIRSFTRFHQARNARGYTHNEVPQRCYRDTDESWKLIVSINTYDPVLKTGFSWTPNSRVVGWEEGVVYTQTNLYDLKPLTPAQTDNLKRSTTEDAWAANEYKIEQLGTRTIHGVLATGTRSTRVIPAGKEGNELPIEITHEIWNSPELQQSLLIITDDSRTGRTTYEVEEILFGEPDASWFVVPEYVRKPVQES